ncbi:hypothetical protein NWFMUON74_31900 [Nocardia wallacei]|uniref:Uncharacterized protein n=1 Tax=Nocardia wallacei TaxID=480035 RepID=A0A7G1KJT0_9NOCA|nr:hypothetical protein NWFMUON74_31900 [Nocardia wallacei]
MRFIPAPFWTGARRRIVVTDEQRAGYSNPDPGPGTGDTIDSALPPPPRRHRGMMPGDIVPVFRHQGEPPR